MKLSDIMPWIKAIGVSLLIIIICAFLKTWYLISEFMTGWLGCMGFVFSLIHFLGADIIKIKDEKLKP